MRKKMVLIGAGSAMFTQGLLMDLIKNPGKNTWELDLVDIDRDVLISIEKLAKKIIEAKKADIFIKSSPDRKDVLPNADYIVTTIGVGGRRAWEQDVFIPRKFGIYQPVGDTAMPGGISRAMRMIPAMLDIVKDVETLCPKARFFNYSNPMAIICRALSKATDFPVTGLCIGVPGSEWEIADMCGFDRSKFTSIAVGVNHLTFIYKMYYDGLDAKPMIDKKILEFHKEEFNSEVIDKFYSNKEDDAGWKSIGEPFAWNFYKIYKAFPAPGDRHITEFLTENFPNGDYYGKKLGIGAYSFEGTIHTGDKIHQEMMAVANSNEKLGDDFFTHIHGEHELLMDIINSIESDKRQIFSVNLPNRGAVVNLPYNAVIEMPAIACAEGFRPVQINDFPDTLAGIVNRVISVFEIAVEAALKGDRKLFEEAILAGGYISDRKAVSEMVFELIKAQKEYLPQF
jgi:alpha-galactosidase